MPSGVSGVWHVKLGKDKAVNLPIEIVRAWGVEGETPTLYVCLEGSRAVIVTSVEELTKYLNEQQEEED